MEDLPLGRIAAMVPDFAVKDLFLGRTLMMMMMMMMMMMIVKARVNNCTVNLAEILNTVYSNYYLIK